MQCWSSFIANTTKIVFVTLRLCSTLEPEMIRQVSTEIGKEKNLLRKIKQGRNRLGKVKEKENELRINARQEEINVDEKKPIDMTTWIKTENTQNVKIWDDCCKLCNFRQTITAVLRVRLVPAAGIYNDHISGPAPLLHLLTSIVRAALVTSQASESPSNKISIPVSDPQQTYINKTRTTKKRKRKGKVVKRRKKDIRRRRKEHEG